MVPLYILTLVLYSPFSKQFNLRIMRPYMTTLKGRRPYEILKALPHRIIKIILILKMDHRCSRQ